MPQEYRDRAEALGSIKVPTCVVPGHDPLVLQRYPALNGEAQGIVHRLDVARAD